MTKKQRYKFLINYFAKNFPEAETELMYNNSYELLVAVILSAQCTDKRVNLVTPKLFERFPSVEDLAEASYEEVFEIIKSISYPNSKSKHLVEAAKRIVEVYEGKIPNSIEELQTLQGVGRKTANVIASVIYKQAAMAVDTHVFRVSHRLGLVAQTATTPLAVEKELVKNIAAELIPKAHHWLILHGRYTCTARNPKCETCALQEICPFYLKKKMKDFEKK
ncbi:MAG: endonuclease III [Raineya sp.]